jgi:hypothetical protein
MPSVLLSFLAWRLRPSTVDGGVFNMVLLHGPKQNVTRPPSQEPEVNQVVQGIHNSAVASFPLAGGMRLSCAVLFGTL